MTLQTWTTSYTKGLISGCALLNHVYIIRMAFFRGISIEGWAQCVLNFLKYFEKLKIKKHVALPKRTDIFTKRNRSYITSQC